MHGVVLSRRASLAIAAVAAAALLALLLAACTGAAPAPTPTAVKPTAAAPTKAAELAKPAEPTKAPTAAPTKGPEPTKPAAPTVAKVDYPQKGRAISMLVGYAAGGSNDIGIRILAPGLEKELGTPVQIVNKPGAATQVQLTELAKSKPDGYTVGQMSPPTNITVYLDPERKATFTGKDFDLVANYAAMPASLAVKADSPFKTLKDLVDAAKAKPDQIKVGDPGLLGGPHLGVLQLGKVADVRFASVHFDGGAPTVTALLGAHIDASSGQVTVMLSQIKSGEIRLLGVMDNGRNEFVPDVKTMEEQGYKVNSVLYHGLAVPTGTPKEIQGVLSAATKKALADPEVQKKMSEAGLSPRYLDAAAFSKVWADMEADVKPLMALAK